MSLLTVRLLTSLLKGSVLISSDASGDVIFWNTFDGYSERRRQREGQAITQITLDQSDDVLFSVDANGQLCVYVSSLHFRVTLC